MIKLVIIDLYGTIWAAEQPIRNGLKEFLQHYQDKKFALATDDPDEQAVSQLLIELGIRDHIKGIYSGKDLKKVNGRTRKDLTKICQDFAIANHSAVFISDGNRDRRDAARDGLRFVHVPYYETNAEYFSFGLINLDDLSKRYTDLRTVNRT